MECRTTPIFQDRTQLKVYSCDFAGTLYSEFVGPNVEIACNTSGIVYQGMKFAASNYSRNSQ